MSRTYIRVHRNKWQLTFRDKYIGLFATEEEARVKLKELQASTPKKSGGKREGAGRKRIDKTKEN